MCEFPDDFLFRFIEKSLNLEFPAPPCTDLGQCLGTGVQKNRFGTKGITLLVALFRTFRDFLTFDFSVIFEVTSDTEL